jgi:hypothetical protein
MLTDLLTHNCCSLVGHLIDSKIPNVISLLISITVINNTCNNQTVNRTLTHFAKQRS